MISQKLYIKNNEDRKSLVSILADNGYVVRMGTEKKPGKTTSRSFVECWLDDMIVIPEKVGFQE